LTTDKTATELTFKIQCDECHMIVYQKAMQTLKGAMACITEKLSDVNKSIESHKMVCSGKDDSELRNRLR
jgi:hypothetical protein